MIQLIQFEHGPRDGDCEEVEFYDFASVPTSLRTLDPQAARSLVAQTAHAEMAVPMTSYELHRFEPIPGGAFSAVFRPTA